MKRKTLIVSGLIAALVLILVAAVQSSTQSDLAKIREATAQFHRTDAAKAAGYDLVSVLDYCFNNPGVGGMGFHYINTAILDTTVELLHPEAMVYIPSPNGLQLGAVEYIVEAATWDAKHSWPPSLFGRTFELNTTLQVYTLHAWIWKRNPLGTFADWNPRASCP